MKIYAAVMLGGAIGSLSRFLLASWIDGISGALFPWGTVIVNIIGCFIIGLFSGLIVPEGPWNAPPVLRSFAIIGVLGGFTTFSSFSLQSVALFRQGHHWLALGNVSLSMGACLLATTAGFALALYIDKQVS